MVDNFVNKKFTQYLTDLGMTRDEAYIYVALSEHGVSTPLQLSRLTGINRTKVYRTTEELAKKKIVQIEIEEHSTRIAAVPPEQLVFMVKREQQRIAHLARDFPEIERQLNELGVHHQADTKVRFYRGKEGIEQMVWNVLKTSTEVVGYTYRDLADFVGGKFMDDFAAEFVRRNLTMRDIYGDEYVKSKKHDADWSDRITSRYLPNTTLTILHQMDIYDNVVSFYNWHEGDVFGVEIHNSKVAHLQRQLFELAWKAGKDKS